MSISVPAPRFGKFLDALNSAGIQTQTARGFWGGVNAKGETVVTSWTDANLGDGTARFYIWKPKTNHGALRTQWELGNIHVGTEVRLILLRQRGSVPLGEQGRSVAAAALLPGSWRIVKMVSGKSWQAIIEPQVNWYCLRRLIPLNDPSQKDAWTIPGALSFEEALNYFEKHDGFGSGLMLCEENDLAADFVLEKRIREVSQSGASVGVRPGNLVATALVRRI